MKLDRVALTNYGSHVDTDWALDGAGLCVLVGPNGAGKTTLAVDALLHVLQDGAAGAADDVVRTGATDSSAIVEFTFAGARYRATRRRTTRSGGKTSAELGVQAADGSWRPVAAGAREVPAAVRELLRMDPATFRSAVVLAQGAADRFLRATAGKGTPGEPGRATILSSIVVPPELALAEAKAREEARDLEARTKADRDHLEAVEAALEDHVDVDQVLADARDSLAAGEAQLAEQRAARAGIEERIRELDAKLAVADAAIADLPRVRAERDGLAAEYKAASGRVGAAQQAIAAARFTLAAEDNVAAAIADLPAARAEVEGLEEGAEQERRLGAEIEAQRRTVVELERPYEQARAGWQAKRDAAASEVARLEARGKAGTSVCQACGQPIGQDAALEQLGAARASLKALLAGEPKAPLAIAREQAALTRLEVEERALSEVPRDVLLAARQQLAELERTAARGEAMDSARATVAREEAAIAAAEADLARISERGKALKARIDELEAKRGEAEPLRVERQAAETERDQVDATITSLERAIREAEREVAGAEAGVRRRDELQAERDQLAAKVVSAGSELAVLRRLVGAFGVTGIPARIIAGVLPELSGYANELLAELRPGVTLDVRGQRARADGSGVIEAIDIVVRDELGERVLERWSGGETTSVALGLALGLSRLAARRAGAAVSTLVVDEPDGLDEHARRALGHALRSLVHRGALERIVAITHTPELAEFADRVDRLEKNGAGSVVSRIA